MAWRYFLESVGNLLVFFLFWLGIIAVFHRLNTGLWNWKLALRRAWYPVLILSFIGSAYIIFMTVTGQADINDYFTICPLAFCLIAEPFRRPAPPSAGEFRREDPAQLKSQTEKSDFSFVVLHGDREERTEKRIMLVCKALSLIVLGMILMTMIDYTISE